MPEKNTYCGYPFDRKMPIKIGDEEVYIEGPDGELHPDIAFQAGPVRYTDIKMEYTADILNEENRDWTKPFFIKDSSYRPTII